MELIFGYKETGLCVEMIDIEINKEDGYVSKSVVTLHLNQDCDEIKLKLVNIWLARFRTQPIPWLNVRLKPLKSDNKSS